MTKYFLSSLVGLVACGGSSVQAPPHPGEIKGPDPIVVMTTPPGLPGVAYINLTCNPAAIDCNGQPFTMSIAGDRDDYCRIDLAQGKLVVQKRNAHDPSQTISLRFDGYAVAATQRYALDDGSRRSVWLTEGLSLPTWTGPSCYNGSWSGAPSKHTVAVSAPDPSCGSPACSVQVADADPTGAFPRPLRFHVSCDSMCVSNDTDVCHARGVGGKAGSIEFDLTAVCDASR